MSSWDMRFLALARHIAGWSKDPSTKVGAVIADPNHRIVSLGYNGFAQGVEDKPHLLHNREEKYKRIIHAEINAILFARQPLDSCTLYTWPFLCCSRCAGVVINSGITWVVSIECMEPRWYESIELSINMFKEAGTLVQIYPSISEEEP